MSRELSPEADHPFRGAEEALGPGVSVVCERFAGPLDVLLSLVRRHQYPPERLPVAEITHLFLEWLRRERTESAAGLRSDQDRIELGGEFIETASWLVLLKSRTLLPQLDSEEAPEAELRRVLLDHETMRTAAALLGERLGEAGAGAGDPAAGLVRREPPVPDSAAPTLADVLEAARRALRRAQSHAQAGDQSETEPVAPDLYTVEEQIAAVRERIASLPHPDSISTEQWFRELPAPEARVALLLALLELARVHEILLDQAIPLDPILLGRPAA